jgi:hypothetical protein
LDYVLSYSYLDTSEEELRKSLLLALLVLAPVGVQAAIVNGDFESGNTGFTTEYSLYPGSGWLTEGEYAVTTSPSVVHSLLAGFADHTTGAGSMLVLNGAASTIAWQGELDETLAPGHTYRLSFWGASAYQNNPALLRVLLNGTALGTDLQLTTTTGQWVNYSAEFVAAGLPTIQITSLIGAADGNDFAIDDIFLTDLGSSGEVPEPASMALFGLGAIAMGLARRFRQ